MASAATPAAILLIAGGGLLYYAIWSPKGVLAKNPISGGAFGGFTPATGVPGTPGGTTNPNPSGTDSPNKKGAAVERYDAGTAIPFPNLTGTTYIQQRTAFINAIASNEGGYNSINPKSGAIGRYQILPKIWKSWGKKYFNNPNLPTTPANQDAMIAARVDDYYRHLGQLSTSGTGSQVSAWARIAAAWQGGSSVGKVIDWHQWSRHSYIYATNAMWHMEKNLGQATN